LHTVVSSRQGADHVHASSSATVATKYGSGRPGTGEGLRFGIGVDRSRWRSPEPMSCPLVHSGHALRVVRTGPRRRLHDKRCSRAAAQNTRSAPVGTGRGRLVTRSRSKHGRGRVEEVAFGEGPGHRGAAVTARRRHLAAQLPHRPDSGSARDVSMRAHRRSGGPAACRRGGCGLGHERGRLTGLTRRALESPRSSKGEPSWISRQSRSWW